MIKKILTVLFALLLVLSLAACGEGAPESEGGNAENYEISDFSFGDAVSGNGTDVVLSELNAKQKAELVAELKAQGVSVTFGADGSTTMKSADGAEIVQKKDGTWVVKGADGAEAQFGGKWPENEYTKQLPKPDFEIVAAVTDNQIFSVVMAEDVSLENIRAYGDKLIAKGYTIDKDLLDEKIAGIDMYSLTADNAAGYRVNLYYTGGLSGLTLEKISG